MDSTRSRSSGVRKHQNGKYFLLKFPSSAFSLERQKRARKSSARAEIITFKLAIFLFMIKYEFEMPKQLNDRKIRCLCSFRACGWLTASHSTSAKLELPALHRRIPSRTTTSHSTEFVSIASDFPLGEDFFEQWMNVFNLIISDIYSKKIRHERQQANSLTK